jgi:leucyl-tRNA synthetase
LSKEALLELAKADANVAKFLKDTTIIKEIVVPDRIVNIVVK